MQDLLTQFDILFVAAVLLLTLVYLYTIGKDFAVTIVLAQYMALGTLLFVPFLNELDFSIGGMPNWLTKVAMLLVLIIVFAYLQINNGYFEPNIVPSSWETPIFAIIFTGMFAAASIGFMDAAALEGISDILKKLFVEEPIADLWFLATPLALLFIKGDA